MQPQFYRTTPQPGFNSFSTSSRFQGQRPSVQYSPNNAYSTSNYMNKAPMRASQQIPYVSATNYYQSKIPPYVRQNQPGMPPILTDQQYKRLYVNNQKKSSIMMIPTQQQAHKPTKSIKGSILRQSNFQQKSLHESNFSHHHYEQNYDYTIEPQKVFCVICEKTYTLDRQEQHLNTHKNRLHQEDFHPIKNIHVEEVLNNLQLHKTSRFNLINDNTKLSRRDNQGIVKPIVQPQQYNIQYNPNEFVVTKNVQYITKQTPPPPRKTYEQFGIGDDDVRPPQRNTSKSEKASIEPVSFILSQSQNVEKQESKRISNAIEIIPQDNQRQEYDRDLQNRNTDQNFETQPINHVDSNIQSQRARNTIASQQKQPQPIKVIQPVILDIFDNPNNPKIQTQEMSFDSNAPTPMYRRVKPNYQYPKQQIIYEKPQPLNQQNFQPKECQQCQIQQPKQPLICTQNCEAEKNQSQIDRRVSQNREKNEQIYQNNPLNRQSAINIRLSDRISKQPQQTPIYQQQTYKTGYQNNEPQYYNQDEIKFEDIIQEKKPSFIKQQQPKKIVPETQSNSFFHSNTPRKTEDYKFVIEEEPQLPQASKNSFRESEITNPAPTFNPISSQNQGKKKKIPRNILW